MTLFFDTLGIGNYAPTTAAFRFLKMVKDELIPGTLNVGTSVPVAIEAFAFVTAIAVDPFTLMVMVPLGAIGGYVGAGIVSRLPRRPIQIGMGAALLTGALFMFLTNMQWIPGGGTAIGFSGAALIVATGRELRARRLERARHRQLCAEPDRIQPDGHGSRGRRSRS